MTRKDYILIARTLRDQLADWATHPPYFHTITLHVAGRIADMLIQDNPRFNREHFLAVVRGEKELTSRPPRAHSLEDRVNHKMRALAQAIDGMRTR